MLAKLRNGGLHFFVFVLLAFPVLVAFRDLVGFLLQDSHWSPLLSLVDAGGQQSLSRSLLRILLIGGCLCGLILPLSSEKNAGRGLPWAGLFLLSGLVSVSFSQRPYASELEWETWALVGLLALLVRRAAVPALRTTGLIALYILVLATFLHALWISVPASEARLGGVFYHANALSTFTLVCLPFLLERAGRRAGLESYLAGFLGGAVLAIWFWAGSLTGACVLVGGTAFWLGSTLKLRFRIFWAMVFLPLPAVLNLWGGAASTVGFCMLFLVLLFLSVYRLGSDYFSVSVTVLGSLLLCCALFSLLAPREMSERATRTRQNSATARVQFYSCAVKLGLESPVFGRGPVAFSREYPRYQDSVLYFSRYVHCIPLEILAEWGMLGFALALFCCKDIMRERALVRASAWALAFFALHCLTGVQTQFPYLLVLVALAYALTREPPEELEESVVWQESAARIGLTLALLALLGLNMARLDSALNLSLGARLFNADHPRARQAAVSFFQASVRSQPMDGQTLFSFAQVQERLGHRSLAHSLSLDAIATDGSWAAPRLIHIETGPIPAKLQAVDKALACDPVNYPAFYRHKAEAFLDQGKPAEALSLLWARAPGYDPLLLNRLPDFRATDLDEQLLEYWLLVAILEEGQGRPERAEIAFRRAMLFTRRLLPRFQRLVQYPGRRRIQVGPVVQDLLDQIAQQIPAE